MEMLSFQLDNNSEFIEGSCSEQQIDNPHKQPRVGDEFQAILPPLISESELSQLYQNSTESETLIPVSDYFIEPWNEIEVESLILGLYIYGKNFVRVKKFMGSRDIGQIMAYYYTKFYGSEKHWLWSECRRKSRSWEKKYEKEISLLGHMIFTGRKRDELLSRLLCRSPQDLHESLLEVSKALSDGGISIGQYIYSLKSFVGIRLLIQAVGIGKGKEDLARSVMDSIKKNQVISFQPPKEPVGKKSSPLTTKDIIDLLKGDNRLGKTRANNLFWQAIWPCLLAKGWHSEQPKSRVYASSKPCLVFLIPGVTEFSRRQLVKGIHYFDSISDLLRKIASEPKLIELEPEPKPDIKNPFDQQCYPNLDSHNSTCKPIVMNFTIVDTSLVHDEQSDKVTKVVSSPVENIISLMTKNPRQPEWNFSKDLVVKPEAAYKPFNEQKNIDNSNDIASGGFDHGCSIYGMPIINSDTPMEVVTNPVMKSRRKTRKKKLSLGGAESSHSNNPAPFIKRQRLSAYAKAEKIYNNNQHYSVEPEQKQEGYCILAAAEDSKNVVSQMAFSREIVSSIGVSAQGYPGESSRYIPSGNSVGVVDLSAEKDEKPQPQYWIDLNIPLDPQNGEPLLIEENENQGNLNEDGFDVPFIMNETAEKLQNVTSEEQQPVMNSRRYSQRNRPPTIRALEAFESGYLGAKRRQKGKGLLA